MSDDDLIRRVDALKLMQLAIDVYGQNMRDAADKKEKRDWQSMLIAAVDIRYAIKNIPAVQPTVSPDVAALVEALEALIQQTYDCEKELTEVLHHIDFCGESEPLAKARAALASVKGGA